MPGREVTLFGAPYSVYVRIVRMALLEKGIDYTLEPVDIFSDSDEATAYRARNPFGRIPALAHGDFNLYETRAITRYIDEAFDGPALQPADPQARARMDQVIGIVDSFAYRTLVWDIYVPHTKRAKDDGPGHAQRIAGALPRARTCLGELDRLLGQRPFFGGTAVSLADIHVAPVLGYVTLVPEARGLLSGHAELSRWWAAVSARASWRAAVGEPECGN